MDQLIKNLKDDIKKYGGGVHPFASCFPNAATLEQHLEILELIKLKNLSLELIENDKYFICRKLEASPLNILNIFGILTFYFYIKTDELIFIRWGSTCKHALVKKFLNFNGALGLIDELKKV